MHFKQHVLCEKAAAKVTPCKAREPHLEKEKRNGKLKDTA
jgi:hypothetical protein